MAIKISSQAMNLISSLKDFDMNEFEDWWYKNKAVVGSTHVIEYLDRKAEGRL